jgi:hypothetical protein
MVSRNASRVDDELQMISIFYTVRRRASIGAPPERI